MNGIRRQYRGQVKVIYASMDESDGKELAERYGVVGTPTILLLDGEDNQVNVLRGSFPSSLVERAVEDLVAQ